MGRARAGRVSGDESLLMMFSGFVGGWGVLRWYWRLIISRQIGRATRLFMFLFYVPPLLLAGIYWILHTAASFDVQNAPPYLLLYSLFGLAWFLTAVAAMQLVGISYRDDVIERRNPAAAIVIVSAALAHAMIYAGANIGDGPGWWTIVAAGGLGSGVWFLLWLIAELACGLSEDITVNRDVPSAVRLGGYALAMGIVCARGAAGDWTSFSRTLVEFGAAWPVVPLTALSIGVERAFRTSSQTTRSIGVSMVVAAAYLALALLAVELAAPLPQNAAYGGWGTLSP